jgi:glucosylceramidase
VDFWLTKGDQSALLQKQNTVLAFGTSSNSHPSIEVDTTQTFQTIEGFGYTLTGGSASLLHGMPAASRADLLRGLFNREGAGIGISYLRLSMGASDLNATVYSYDDLPAGQTDPSLSLFSLSLDTVHVLPILKEILSINPQLRLLATPWSPPVWMKDNGRSVGGSLKQEFYSVYAQYFIRYIQAMKAQGVTIDAITPQNEPLNDENNPSMHMTAEQQADFIKNYLGPAFQAAGLGTKIIIYDHNADHADYPMTILNDPAANAFVHGAAFHLYAGDISALSTVRNAHPDKGLYFTEQYTASGGSFGGDLKWHLKNVIIGSLRNWSRIALEWNLANDPAYGPHTPGGCTTCKGALTIGVGAGITYNVSYYIIGHASKFVPPGSVRIASNLSGSLQNVAFKTPAGTKVLIVENDGATDQTFNIKFNGKWVLTTLSAGGVGTYVWN